LAGSRVASKYYDFTTGGAVSNYSSGDITAALPSIIKYASLCKQYERFLLPGYWNFPDPASIPEDLFLSFGDFVTKHDIKAILPWAWSTTGNGVGNLTEKMTIWAMQAFGGQMARLFLQQQAAFVPASGRNADIYDAIAKFLGDDILYSTIAINSTRTTEGVTIAVKNRKTGEKTTIKAKKLLVAIPPLGPNQAALDLDKAEQDVFGKIQYTREYAGIAASLSLPVGSSLINMPEAANASTYTFYPQLNFTQRFESVSPNNHLFRVVLVGDETFYADDATALAQKNLDDLASWDVLPTSNQLNWVAFRDHGAMHVGVSAQELKSGWMQEFYALQGQRSTWYTGGTWSAPFQTVLWEFNEVLLPKMLAA
jgi:hypothetical protein